MPKQWSDPETLDLQPNQWAMDNGAFSGFDVGAFVRMLERFATYAGCLFVTAPDVVGDAAATLELWPWWSTLIAGIGRRAAFVAQDGLVADRVPWERLSDGDGVLFIGGTTTFKDGPFVRTLCGMAKARGIWVHWGRVNTKRRYELALLAGADSIDGTGFSMYPDTNIPKVVEWDEQIERQPTLDIRPADSAGVADE